MKKPIGYLKSFENDLSARVGQRAIQNREKASESENRKAAHKMARLLLPPKNVTVPSNDQILIALHP